MAVSPSGKILGSSVIRLMIWPFKSCRGSLANTTYLLRPRVDRHSVGFVSRRAGTLMTPLRISSNWC